MTMVELVNVAREKLDKSKERQKKLIENLVDSRGRTSEKTHPSQFIQYLIWSMHGKTRRSGWN